MLGDLLFSSVCRHIKKVCQINTHTQACSFSVWGSKNGLPRLHFHFSLSYIGEGNGNPLQCSCLENPRDGRAWWASVYGVTQSWTRLKWLSSSSSSSRVVNWPGFNTLASQVLGEVLRRDERWEKSCWWNRQHTHNIYPWSLLFHLGVICGIPKQLKWYHQRSQLTITI